MIRVVLILISSVLFVNLDNKNHNAVSSFTVADSLKIQLFSVLDTNSIPNLYFAKVTTPVCEVDKCYTIELDFYWDLIGRYHHYDTIPGKELTKLDHKPFEGVDYYKLHEILSNPGSPLASYSKEELVKNTRSSEIDGFTGATIQEIKDNVIGGAVYSCHTLWHIAYGNSVDSIQKSTKSMFTADLVQKLVKRNDQEINYYLINNFSPVDFENYLPFLLETISKGQGYYAKNALEKIPNELFKDSLAQDFFASNFSQLNYFAQVTLLEKLTSDSIGEELKTTLHENLEYRNSYKDNLIKSLLSIDREQ